MADIMMREAVSLSAWLVVSALVVLAADPVPEPLKVPPRPLEEFKLTPGTVIVVRGDPREAFGKADAVVLTPDEYKRLLDQIEQLQKKVSPDKPEAPSKCRISGRVDSRGRQEMMKVQATFEFVSTPARTAFFLGLRNAAAVGATLDGSKVPLLNWNSDGFTVTVDTPGSHKLVVDLELSLQYRAGNNGERGFTLNLPGSPITVIDQIEVPPGVQSVRLRPVLPSSSPLTNLPRTWPAADLRKPPGEWPALALGAVEGLDVFWDGPAPAKPAEPLTTAEGEIRVQITETSVQTTAALTLKSLRGPVAEWKLTTPPGAEVSVVGTGPDSGFIVTPTGDDRSQWVIRGREGGAESVALEIVIRAARKAGPVPVGPFVVQGALRQYGTIRVLAPNHLRARFSKPRNDVSPRELPPEETLPADAKGELLQAAFGYGQVMANSPISPFLQVDAEVIRGEIRTQVSHLLTLTESGWRLTTDIKASPIRTEMESLEVEIPSVLQAGIQASPPELVEKIERVDPANNRFVIRFAHARRVDTVIRLDSVFPIAPKAPGGLESGGRESASLSLPRVLNTFDRDGRVTVAVQDGLEVRGVVHEWDRGRLADWARSLEEQSGKPPTLSLTMNRTPARVELSWLPLSALIPVRSTVDLTLDDRQATVLHRITLPKSPNPRQLTWQTSVGQPLAQVRVVEGGSLAARGGHEWLLTVPASPDQETVAVLAYSWPMPEGKPSVGRQFETGLLWPMTVAGCETRLRVWMRGLSGLRPAVADGAWEELPPELATDHDTLPALVLHGSGSPVPLAMRWEQAAGLAPAGLIAERALIQVRAEGSQHHYVARFRLLPMAATFVDVELPSSVGALNDLVIMLADKRVQQLAIVDESGSPVPSLSGRIVRVPLPAKRSALELRVEYFMSSWRPGGGLASQWRIGFVPPKLRGSVFVGAVRWHVALPGSDFVLPGDDRTVLDQRWGLRRFLPAPVPSRNAEELERWFRAGLDEASSEGFPEYSLAGTEAVVRQSALEPIQLIPVPRMPWLLVCSLLVLGVGGLLALLRRSRFLFWLIAMAVLLVCTAASILWPQTSMAALAGTPPGWLVLCLLLLFLGWQSRRYRRRVVFMPGFSRSKPVLIPSRPASAGSSARRREPSTVDAPPSG